MQFLDNIRVSFKKVKRDMFALKQSLHEWVAHLHSNQKQMQERMEELEGRIRELELERLSRF